MNNNIIFSMSGVTKTFPPQKTVLKNIHLSFFYGAKIGVLGLNGSGKSSLLNIIAGKDKDFQGEVNFVSEDYTVGMLEQEPELDPEKTAKQIVEEGLGKAGELLKEFELINLKFAEPMSDQEMADLIDRQAEVQEQLDSHNAWELENKVERAMSALRCPPADAIVKNLSGGEKRRLALCRLLLIEPHILLLDEPTNHLDAESVDWLEQFLQNYKGTVIAVTHDRYFLDNVAGWILELDRGEGIPWEGNYSSWLEQKQNRLAREEKSESKRQKTLARELEWIRMSPKARQAKSKARISAYESMVKEESSKKEARLELFIPTGPRLGTQVVEAKNVSMGFGDRVLYENLDFSLPQGGIVGIVGPNGSGKTTLFKMITGELEPTKGEFKTGDTVKIAYVDQSHDNLDPKKSIYEIISNGADPMMVGDRSVNARAYVSKFNFGGQDQEKKIASISGGERNRVHLAMALKEGANLLLLDEPTNDLDINTLRALEDALNDFAGCAVIISHDRWFLDRVATHILSFEGDAGPTWFEGNYSDYEADRSKRA